MKVCNLFEEGKYNPLCKNTCGKTACIIRKPNKKTCKKIDMELNEGY